MNWQNKGYTIPFKRIAPKIRGCLYITLDGAQPDSVTHAPTGENAATAVCAVLDKNAQNKPNRKKRLILDGRTAPNGGIIMKKITNKVEEVKAEEVKAEEVKEVTDFTAIINKLTRISGGVTVIADVKTQREAIEAAAPKTWTEFKVYLASVNYTLTPTKRILCDVGGMTAAEYTRLSDFLTVARACMVDWKSAKMRLDDTSLSKARKKEISDLVNVKEKAVYTALKGIRHIFDIEGKCKPSDIEWLASRVITVKYRDRTNIKLGYTLSVSGNMTILSNIFKLVSASNDGQTALENAQVKLLKKNADGIKAAVKELTDLETAEAAQLETTEN